MLNRQELAALIDHTLLKPEAVEADIEKLCMETLEYGFASACVNSIWVRKAANLLKGSPSLVCSVIGFP
ncbi:MAG: 2-deoxyribose-5-phosphate aldolase, partial [Candidatus Aegiribacteria sp.]|nr:2-deoxyribose-5-phosphate aldolase [Candidatus Aegiribacteria sp.]MBD3295191.1 2-deoxyribose-5-phosphate aldolase [Candidatus Fermentibacteria bacterium]